MVDEKTNLPVEYEPGQMVARPAGATVLTPTIIKPVGTVDEALEAWKQYQDLKMKLAGEGDFQRIPGKAGKPDKLHPTKQFANKLSRFFGLSVKISRETKEVLEDGNFVWHVVAIAMAPNGQYREGDGHCDSSERAFAHLQHDVYATAVTRAKNRAILELVGFGEVSAEEIIDEKRTGHADKQAARTATSVELLSRLYQGLMSYGENPVSLDKRAVEYIHKAFPKSGAAVKRIPHDLTPAMSEKLIKALEAYLEEKKKQGPPMAEPEISDAAEVEPEPEPEPEEQGQDGEF